MQTINATTLEGIIDHVAIRHHHVPFIWGPMGVGKSRIVEQVAKRHSATLVDIRLSQYDSVDLRGFPGVADDNTTVWYVPSTMPFKGNPRFDNDFNDPNIPIFLFFDEANGANPAVSLVTYQITNDRRCGEHELLDNVVMIMAGNRDQDRGVTNRQPAPLSNRLCHVELQADIKPWSFWAQKNGVAPELIAYLNFEPEALHTFDPAKPNIKAFGTPRSWEKANGVYLDELMPADVKIAAISGWVGENNAIQFNAFCEIWKSLTPIEDIIANPDKVAVPEKLDVQYAMACHVSGHMSKTTSNQLHRYLDRMQPEMVVLAWTLAINRDEDVTDTDAFLHSYAPKYRSLFQDS